MKLKDLNQDAVFTICQLLGMGDLFSLFNVSKSIKQLAESRQLFVLRAKSFGIYDSSYQDLNAAEIKHKIITHMRAVYKAVRSVCSARVAKPICCVILEDDSVALESNLKQDAIGSARALMPIALKFSRLKLMHSLFNHYHVDGSNIWLLQAIREEQYDAVRYLVEIKKVALITTENQPFFRANGKKWCSDYNQYSKEATSFGGGYMSYNETLLQEIIRCHHPKIVAYLKGMIEKIIQEQDNDPMMKGLIRSMRSLFVKIRRHSLDGVQMKALRESPDLSF